MPFSKKITKISVLIFLIFIFCDKILSTEKAAIVYTNSLNGNFDYCHCKEDPKGGLVKRATEIKKIRKKYKNLFLFETGDFFLYDKDILLAKYLIKAYKQINYDALMFGDQEFSIGIKEFLKYKTSLPFVCNNIRIKASYNYKNYFKRFIVINKNGINAGVIGTVSKDAFRYYPVKLVSRIKILDQVNEIKKDIVELKKQGINFIILLSHSGFEIDKKLAKKIKDIDVIIGGHSQTLVKKPYRSGNTIIVQAGSNGARIGILELVIINGKIVNVRNTFKLPDEFHPEDDRGIRKLIDNYKKEVRQSVKKNKLKFD